MLGGSGRGILRVVAFCAAVLVAGVSSAAESWLIETPVARGMGFVVRPGIVVTSAHLLVDLRIGQPVALRAVDGGPVLPARLLARSARLDLALLEVPVRFAPPSSAAIQQRDAAARDPGRPLLRGRVLRHTVLQGVGPGAIVALEDAHPGQSGAPVADAQGQLVGMLSAIRRAATSAPRVSAYAPRRPVDVAGYNEAFVLSAAAVQAEVVALLHGL